MTLGVRDTRSLLVLPGIDADALENYRTEANVSYGEIVSVLTAGLSAVLGETEARYANLIAVQREPEVKYRSATTTGFTQFTEYGKGDPQRGETTGHMLPLEEHDRVLEWTWSYLRKANVSQIEADIAQALGDVRKLARQKILSRLVNSADDTGDEIGLGSTGVSPALVNAGSAISYTPVPYGGKEFTSSHSHFLAYNNGGVFTKAMFDAAKDDLVEHGILGPYELWISPTDEAAVSAITGFAPVMSQLFTYGSDEMVARFFEQNMDGSRIVGAIGDFAVRVVNGWPTKYAFAYKPMGAFSAQNPIRIRLPKIEAPMVFAMSDPRGLMNANQPLQGLMLYSEFGVGVGENRLNGVAIYNDSATWVNGTVS